MSDRVMITGMICATVYLSMPFLSRIVGGVLVIIAARAG